MTQFRVTEDRDSYLLLTLAGRLDAAGVERVDASFKEEIVTRGKTALVDMSGVEFLGSLGIGMLLAAAQALAASDARLGLFGLRPIVREALRWPVCTNTYP